MDTPALDAERDAEVDGGPLRVGVAAVTTQLKHQPQIKYLAARRCSGSLPVPTFVLRGFGHSDFWGECGSGSWLKSDSSPELTYGSGFGSRFL